MFITELKYANNNTNNNNINEKSMRLSFFILKFYSSILYFKLYRIE
jgi:hypothetical protein